MDQLPRDWLKELPLLKKPTIMTMMKRLLILDIKSMDQLPRDWLKELPLLKKPTIMTMMKRLLILDIKSMDHPRRDWLKVTVTLLPLDLEGMRHHLSRHLAW